jgi:hypothetical protein
MSIPWTEEAWATCTPIAGTYRFRRPGVEHWSKREWQAVLIWWGPPPDPVTGLLLDRAPRWQALMQGQTVEIHEVWPWCGRNAITEADYEQLLNGRVSDE